MIEILHLGSFGLAAVGAICAAAAKDRPKFASNFCAVLMLAAMADAMLPVFNVPAVGWAMILLLAALTAGFLNYRVHCPPGMSQVPSVMALHRNIGLILMAALLLLMDAHTVAVGAGSHSGHSKTDLLGLLLGGGSVLYLAASTRMTFRGAHTQICDRLESAFMGLSVMAMAGGFWT